jgi:hypothetical protein
MKHSRFGLVFVLSCGGLLACNGDPTASIRDDNPPEIVTDPSVLFLNQGESKSFTVQLVDAQGNQLPADFDATSGGSQVTVTQDTTFLQTTNGTNLNTKERFVVVGAAAGQTAITVTGGGATLDLPVSVVPTDFAATFSNAAPAVNESVTLTAPSGYTFAPDVAVLFGADSAVINSVAPDGSSLAFQVLPGTTGPATVAGVNVSFIPGAPLTLPTVDAITASSTITPLAGTDAPGTAPALPLVPGLLVDAGPYGGSAELAPGQSFPTRWYSFTIAEDGDYDITLDWASAEDLGAYFFLPDGTTAAGDPADAGGGGAHPETVTNTFTAGTYLVGVVNFSATDPASFSLKITPTP